MLFLTFLPKFDFFNKLITFRKFIMRLIFYVLTTLFSAGLTFGQTCTPLQSWADTVEIGAYPDTLVNFPDAGVDVFYSTDLNFKVPDAVTDKLDPSGNFVGNEIVSFVVNSVDGIPEGINFNCNATNCEYLGGENGCANIFGTPTTPGTYDIVINITATINLVLVPGLPPTPVDQDTEFTGYKIVVQEDLSTSVISLDELAVYPNPFNNELIISNPNNETLAIQLINSLGEVVLVDQINELEKNLDTSSLPSGVYTLVSSNNKLNQQIKVVKP